MKRLAAFAFVALSLIPDPALADHGGEWGTWEMREIRVLDSIGPSLKHKNAARLWRQDRREVFAEYSKAGFTFTFSPAPPCPPFPEVPGPSGSISLCRSRSNQQNFASHVKDGNTITAARVQTTPFQAFLCHELGHALGLGHQSVGSGCMASVGGLPDAHDLAELQPSGTTNAMPVVAISFRTIVLGGIALVVVFVIVGLVAFFRGRK